MAAKSAAKKKSEAKEDGEEKKPLTREEKLKVFLEKVNKAYGKDTIGTADRMRFLLLPRIPLGVFPLDLAMGGGVPRGRVIEFYGDKSGGKTTSSLRTIASAQRMCRNCTRPAQWEITETIDEESGEPRTVRKGTCNHCKNFEKMQCAYVDAEGALDIDWARTLGVWTDELFITRPQTAEQTVDMVDNILRTGACDLLVVDSVAALTPLDEIEQSSEKWQQGLQARLVNKMIRKITAAMNEMGRADGIAPTIILINQLRMKIGVMFGSPDTTPGGKGQGFAHSIEVKCWAGPTILDKTEEKESKSMAIPLLQTLNFKVTKNKTAPPGMEGEYMLVLADTEIHKKGDIADEEMVYEMACKYGVLKPHAEKVTKVIGPGIDEDGLQRSQVQKLWTQDRELYSKVKDLIQAVYKAI